MVDFASLWVIPHIFTSCGMLDGRISDNLFFFCRVSPLSSNLTWEDLQACGSDDRIIVEVSLSRENYVFARIEGSVAGVLETPKPAGDAKKEKEKMSPPLESPLWNARCNDPCMS